MKTVSVLDVHRFVDDVHRRAGRQDLHVTFDNNAPMAYTDGKKVVLPACTLPMTWNQFVMRRGEAIHEVGHLLRPQVFDIVKENGIDMRTPIGMLFNIVEDSVQENVQASKYKGDAKALSDMSGLWTDIEIEQASQRTTPPTEDTVKLTAAHGIGRAANKDWNTGGNAKLRTVIDTVGGDKAVELWEELTKEGWSDRIKKGGTPEEVFELTKELFKRLFNQDPEEEIERQKKNKPAEQGNSSQELSPETMVQIKILMSKGHGKAGTDKEKTEKQGKVEGEPKPTNLTSEYTLWTPSQQKMVHAKNRTRDDGLTDHLPSGAKLLGNRLRHLLQSTLRTHWRVDLPHGKIRYSALYRRQMPRVGNGQWNRNVFKKRKPAKELNTALTVLVDWSGSMEVDKRQCAADSTILLNEVLSKVLRIPVEILAFSCTGSGPFHITVKDFNEKMLSTRDLYYRFNCMRQYQNRNADAEAILWAVSRLQQRREDRKVLLVLSDGLPTESNVSYSIKKSAARQALLDTVKAVRTGTDIELHGIGVMNHSIQDYYGTKAPIINKLEDLLPAMIATFQSTETRQ